MSEDGGFFYLEGARSGTRGPDAARFRQRKAGQAPFYVFADAAIVQQALRNVKGQFSADQSTAENVFYRLALELQDLMVEELNKTIVRKGVSTGRLARVLKDPRNRMHDRFGMAVGNEDFLNSSDAKYWRAIDQGTTYFLGRTIKGIWGSSIAGTVFPGGEYGPYPKAGPEYSPFGDPGAGQRLRPMGTGHAYRALRAAGFSAKEARAGRQGVINRPIEAHGYMPSAWKRFNPARRGEAIMQQVYGESRVVPVKGPRRKRMPPSR